MVLIAAHFRQINGASRTLVLSMKQSIHDRHFRLASPLVMGFVVPKPVDIRFSIIIPLVPAYLTIIGNGKGPAVLKGYLLHQHFLKLRDDNIFIFFLIHESKGVMVLHHYKARALAPNVEHGAVHDVGERPLRVICNGFPEGCRIISPSKKPPLSSSKANKISKLSELVISPHVPTEMRREGLEVLRLKSDDNGFGEVGLEGEGFGLTS